MRHEAFDVRIFRQFELRAQGLRVLDGAVLDEGRDLRLRLREAEQAEQRAAEPGRPCTFQTRSLSTTVTPLAVRTSSAASCSSMPGTVTSARWILKIDAGCVDRTTSCLFASAAGAITLSAG